MDLTEFNYESTIKGDVDISEASADLCRSILKEIAKPEKLYDLDYSPKLDTDIDKAWLGSIRNSFEAWGIGIDTARIESIEELTEMLKDDTNAKAALGNILPQLQYTIDGISVTFGAMDITQHLERVKELLDTNLRNYRESIFRDSGFLHKLDRKYIDNAAPRLIELIESLENVKAVVYLTTGARLLYPFIKGFTEDTPYLYGNNVDTAFLQCSRNAKQDEIELIKERVNEIVRTSSPPYLIIDDYVTNEHTSHDIVVDLFKAAGIENDQLTFFAFIAEGSTEDEVLDKDYYLASGINVGTFDSYSTPGFYFNSDINKGTLKNRAGMYETVIVAQDSTVSKHDVKPSERKRNIRRSLYYYGKKCGNRLFSHPSE